jgi:peptidoglycan-N-acetylglucosamine deacetylase
MKKILFILLLILFTNSSFAQNFRIWNNKQCAVALTYDDALAVHLDNVIPLLDSFKIKGTFYIIGSSEILFTRMDEWKKAASNGHELGNHTMFHPCYVNSGSSNAESEADLSKYTIERAVNEISATNILLKAMDGRETRSFAYPCGSTKIGDSLFFKRVENSLTGARGVGSGMKTIDKVNLENINCYMINMHSADYMIDLVKQAMHSNTLLVFLFHGVGGGHDINVDIKEHSKLIHFLKDNENNIWIAPLTDISAFIKNYQIANNINN